MHRRIFAAAGGLIALILLCDCDNGTGSPAQSACGLAYAAIGADTSVARAYIQERTQCLDGAQSASRSGNLLRVLFDPGRDVLTAELNSAYAKLNFTTPDIAALTASTVSNLGNGDNFALAEIAPTLMEYFGCAVPVFIIVNRSIVQSSYIHNDADIESLFNHELQHVADWHDGITLPDAKIDDAAFKAGTASAKWIVQLMEMRADYRVLSVIYKDQAERDSIRSSYEWFSSQAPNYLDHWNGIATVAQSGLEKAAFSNQRTEFKGIMPEVSGDSLLMHFNLYGKSNTAVFVSQGPAPKGSAEAGVAESKYSFMGWKP
jgi:hypothetical protein